MESIETSKAPKAIGPYSQAIKTKDSLFCSGQIGINHATGELVGDTITDQTHQVLKNIQAILEAGAASFKHVVKVDIFMTDLATFSEVNKIYAEYFNQDIKPSRVTVGVFKLPKNALIEISCVAVF